MMIPDDFFTHKHSWRAALEFARDNSAFKTEDSDDRAYWEHELRAFDRAYAELEAQCPSFSLY